jgi:hypothetical protein
MPGVNGFRLGDILELRISYVANLQRCMNVCHWTPRSDVAGLTAYETAAEFVDRIRTIGVGGLLGSMQTMMSNAVVIDTISAQKIFPSRWRAYTWEGADTGVQADACDAQNVQASIEKIAENADRHGVGAWHQGGLPNTLYSNGFLTAPGIGALGAIANNLKLALTVTDADNSVWDPCILNKTKVVVDGKDKYVISGYSLVVDTDVKEEIRVMNRRTVGRGI